MHASAHAAVTVRFISGPYLIYLGRGRLRMSVIINGTVCRNCWDVDWARKVEAEQKDKREADAARP